MRDPELDFAAPEARGQISEMMKITGQTV